MQGGFKVAGERSYIRFGGVPGAHQAAAAAADEVVKDPAFVPEGADGGFGDFGEDGVGVAGEKDFDFGNLRELIVEELGHGVGVAAVFEPRAVLEHADPGSGEETHFGGELAGLFAAEGEFFGEFEVEEDDSVSHVGAVFGAAKAEDIHAGLPGDLFGREIEVSDGIGEAGAIHVEFEAKGFGAEADGVEFFGGVNGAYLSGLGDGNGAGFGEMEVSAAADDAFDAIGIDFAIGGLEEEDFGAVGKEFGGAAFVGFDVGNFGAEDGVIGLAE